MPVILMRHGQSEGNLRHIFQGSLDYPLTDLGRAQARRAARWLAGNGLRFDAIMHSALQRAAETAGIVAAEMGCDAATAHTDLNEIYGGELEGLTNEECVARFPDYADRGLPQSADFTDYGGESYEQINARIANVIEAVRRGHPEPQTVGIVAHGGTLYQLLKQWCGWPVPRHFFVAMSNCVMIGLEQREIRGHLGAELKWMLPLDLLESGLTADWRIADSPGGE